MAIVGSAREDRTRRLPPLVGVAPSGRIAKVADQDGDIAGYEPNHTHFILAHSESWGGETGLMFRVAASLAGKHPVVVVLAGGGDVAEKEAREAVRRGWPVIVIGRSGGLAKQLARAYRATRMSRWRMTLRLGSTLRIVFLRRSELALRAMAEDGDLRLFGRGDSSELARWLSWEFSSDRALKTAWRFYAGYNERATALHRWFTCFQGAIVGLGLLATGLAIAFDRVGSDTLRWAAIVTPSLTALTVAIANWLGAGKRWVVLRDAAERSKEQIYRYRTATGSYRHNGSTAEERARAKTLSDELNAIDAQLIGTPAMNGPIAPNGDRAPPALNGMRDDTVSKLDGDRYVEHRLADQLAYYRRRVEWLNRCRLVLMVASLAFGAAGTVLGAAKQEIWIPFTTAISAGSLFFLSTLQADHLIVVYNQSAAELDALRRDWLGGQTSAENSDALKNLVDQVETVLTNERHGWVKQMSTTVAEPAERAANER
jgi:hypothetical protein